MPKYQFSCECGHKTERYLPNSVELLECPACKKLMKREFPNITSDTQVKELIDPYTNKTWNKDQKDQLRERRTKYYRDVEIPRLIETYSLETCLEQKWLKYNDKGELEINKDWVPEK